MADNADGTKEELSYCPVGCKPAEDDRGNCPFLMSAYVLAGLAMMLNIRLSYSSAPYALIRFQLPENLFSVFVRRMASALELWCLPGFIIADAMELAVKLVIKLCESDGYGNNTLNSKKLKFRSIIVPSIVAQWLNFLTYVILFFVYLAGDDQGHLTTFYWTIAVSGFVFGINNVFVFAADYNYIPIYIAGENCFPALTSFIHYLTTLMFGNRRKWDSDFLIVYIDIFVAIIISFAAAAVWTWAYGICTDSGPFDGKITYTTPEDIKSIIITYTTTQETTTQEIKGTGVTINYGTCPTNQADTAPLKVLATQANITVTKEGNKITLKVTITPDAAGKLASLSHLTAPVKCNVSVEGKKLTIKYDTDAGKKCIDIEITGITPNGALKNLGLTGDTDCTVNVDPAPNHLTIKYTTATGDVTKTGAVDTTTTEGNSMTEKIKKIAQGIKKTAEPPATDNPDGENYYKVTYHTSKISYFFKLTGTQPDKLAADKPIAEAPAKIIVQYGHIFAEGFSDTDAKASMISPLLIVLVGMGLVYAIYPGIAPGMIVPFYLVDKIEMVLLIATIFPPVIIALLQRFHPNWSPKTKFLLQNFKFKFGGWEQYQDDDFTKGWPPKPDPSKPVYAQLWHFFDLLMIIMIILAYLFIYSLHYRDSNISRAIVNQPKMSTALTIVFYMCHEISLAVGFPGMVANAAEYTVIAQMVGAFLMVFLALYSEGYIIEYKSHDPAHWPTEGMTKWNAFCYWTKKK